MSDDCLSHLKLVYEDVEAGLQNARSTLKQLESVDEEVVEV